MLKLNDLIGTPVGVALRDSEKGWYEVVLHGVETGGLWIEGGDIDKLLAFLRTKPRKGQPPTKPVVFVPYSQIMFLIADSTVL